MEGELGITKERLGGREIIQKISSFHLVEAKRATNKCTCRKKERVMHLKKDYRINIVFSFCRKLSL